MCCPGGCLRNQEVALYNEVVEEYNQLLEEYRLSLVQLREVNFDSFEALMQGSRQDCAVVYTDSLDKQEELNVPCLIEWSFAARKTGCSQSLS